jgi:hypothetical protein
MPTGHIEHPTAESLSPLIGVPLAAILAQPAIAAKGEGMVLVTVWTVVNVTASLWSFAAQHLLHFFALYWPYLPPVDVIIAVPIVIVDEYILN